MQYNKPSRKLTYAIRLKVYFLFKYLFDQDLGITGKEATPFLLKRLNELTKGASLRANIALVGSQSYLNT
jgi:pseudouridine-5'-phosphate glycosidase